MLLGGWLIEEKPTPVERSMDTWREGFISGLREEQLAAAARVGSAKQSAETPDSFDRDVAGWLAAGLVDLLADKVTGAIFITPPRGIFARLAAGEVDAQFNVADFLRPAGLRFMEAGRAAQSMLTKLSLASTSQFRDAAVRLANLALTRLQATEKSGVKKSLGQRLIEGVESRGQVLFLFADSIEVLDSIEWRMAVQHHLIHFVIVGEVENLTAIMPASLSGDLWKRRLSLCNWFHVLRQTTSARAPTPEFTNLPKPYAMKTRG